MGNKIFTTVVLLLWGATMSWLVCAKILPPFFHGAPPSLGKQRDLPVAWRVSVAGAPIGWTVSRAIPGAMETTEVHRRVVLKRVPLEQLAPGWMTSLIQEVGALSLDLRTLTVLDPLGNLSTVETSVGVNHLPAAIKMHGTVKEGMLHLHLQYSGVSHRLDYPWPEHATLRSELHPESNLLAAYVGRRWKQEVYNPFGGLQGTLELLEAEVVEELPLLVDQQMVTTRRIEYRSMSSTGVSSQNRKRAELWVAEEGRVLREELRLMGVVLRLDRVNDKQAAELANELLDLEHYATLGAPPSEAVSRKAAVSRKVDREPAVAPLVPSRE